MKNDGQHITFIQCMLHRHAHCLQNLLMLSKLLFKLHVLNHCILMQLYEEIASQFLSPLPLWSS